MRKKNDKRLCWNCDGTVPFDLSQCPYCGVTLESIAQENPFEVALKESSMKEMAMNEPAGREMNFGVSQDDWNQALEKKEVLEKREAKLEAEMSTESTMKKESKALLLLLPGASLALFGLTLLLFAENGSLTLSWKENFAYLYLIGACPLLFLGWRSLK